MGYKESELSSKLGVVIGALENHKFRCRTIKGIADELSLSPTAVRQALVQLKDQLVRLPARTAEGENVIAYTTRRHHFGSMSIGEKLLSALRNRA